MSQRKRAHSLLKALACSLFLLMAKTGHTADLELKLVAREAAMVLVSPGEAYTHFFSVRNLENTPATFLLDVQQSLGWTTLEHPRRIEIPPSSSAILSVVVSVPANEVAGSRNETRLRLRKPDASEASLELSAWAELRAVGQGVFRGIHPDGSNPPADPRNFQSSIDVSTMAGSFWVELENRSNATLGTHIEVINSGQARARLSRDREVLIRPFEKVLIPISIDFSPEKTSAVFYLKIPNSGSDFVSEPYVVRYLDPSRSDLSHGNSELKLKGGLQLSSRAIIIDQRREFEQRYRAQLQGPVSDFFYASFVMQGMMTPYGVQGNHAQLVDTLYLHLLGTRSEMEFGWPIDPRLFGVPTDGPAIQGFKAQYFLENVDLGIAAGQEIDHQTLGATAGAQLRVEDNQRIAVVLAHSGALEKDQVGTLYAGHFPIGTELSFGPTVSVVLGPVDDYRIWHRSLLRIKKNPKLPVVVFVENRADQRQEIHRVGVRAAKVGDVWDSSLAVGTGIARQIPYDQSVLETDVTAYVGRPIYKDKVRGGLEFQFTRMDGEAYVLNEISLGPRISTRVNDRISIWTGLYGLLRQESAEAQNPGYRAEFGLEYLNKNHSVILYGRRRSYDNATSPWSGALKTEDLLELRYQRRFESALLGRKIPGVLGLFVRGVSREDSRSTQQNIEVGGDLSFQTKNVTWSLYASSRPEVGIQVNIPLGVPTEGISPVFGGVRGSILVVRAMHEATSLPGLRVRLLNQDQPHIKITSLPADEDGIIRILKIPAGHYRLELIEGSYPSSLIAANLGETLHFPADNRKQLLLHFNSTRALSAVAFFDVNKNGVVDEGERLEENVQIELSRQADDPSKIATAKTDRFGRVNFSRLPMERLWLNLRPETLIPGARASIDLPVAIESNTSVVLIPLVMEAGVPAHVIRFESVFIELDAQVIHEETEEILLQLQNGEATGVNFTVQLGSVEKSLSVPAGRSERLSMPTRQLGLGGHDLILKLADSERTEELRSFRIIKTNR